MNAKLTLILTDVIDEEHFKACVNELMNTLVSARHDAKLHFGNGSNVVIESVAKAPLERAEIKCFFIGD